MTDPGSFSARTGRRLLVGAFVVVAVLAGGIAWWTVDKALGNPEVRARRPSWLNETVGFDVPFWLPLFLTVVVGAVFVLFVFWRAYRRLQAGDDLYAGRHGRGVRRRGEHFLGESRGNEP